MGTKKKEKLPRYILNIQTICVFELCYFREILVLSVHSKNFHYL